MRYARLHLPSTKTNSAHNSMGPFSFRNCTTVVTVHSSSLDMRVGASTKLLRLDIEFLPKPNFPVTFQTPSCSRISTIQRQHSQTRAIQASLLALSLLRRPIRALQISTPPARTQPAARI